MGNLYFILVFAVMAIALIAVILIARTEKKRRREYEKELKRIEEQERHTAEIISEANKTKAEANSGDFMRDSEYMAQRLHHHATR